jgi:DNA-binding response OmpR family regulator
MTASKLLAIARWSAASSVGFDRRVALAQVRMLDPGVLRRAIDPAANGAPAKQRSCESAETIVFVAVPLSMLTSAEGPSAGASRRSYSPRSRYQFGGWSLALHEQLPVAPGGGVLHLRKTECTLMGAFVEQPWQVLTRRTLAAQLLRPNRPMPSDRAIDSYVCRLRARFRQAGGPALIASVFGVGYRFDSNVRLT